MKVVLDFETRSESDIRSEGAFKYSMHPSTRATCLAYKVNEKPVRLIRFEEINKPFKNLNPKFQEIWTNLIKMKSVFVAHNAFFETAIYKNILVARLGWPDIPFDRFRCTAAKAAACALPRSLEGAGSALNLTTQKDRAGYMAMMQTCKPSRQYNDWLKKGKGEAPPKFLEPSAAPEVFETLYRYCAIDVETEYLLDRALPDLISQELTVWFLNQQVNWRGVRVDIPLVKKIHAVMEIESKIKLKELDKLTLGLVTKPGARASILEFLKMDGIELPDIRAKTVDDVLKDGKLSDDARTLLELRKALSKTSTKKYEAMLDRANDDWRIRDITLYCGASTGRDSGTGLQVHNMVKSIIPMDPRRPYAAVTNAKDLDVEMLKLLYGDNLVPLFSSILRNMIIPTEGCELFAADFAKIEVAVLWWLAGNEKGLNVLRSGKDPYIYQAAVNLGKTYEEIAEAVKRGEDWAVDARQLGKAQILGCGFGMGATKFQMTGWEMYRLRLSDEQAKFAVDSYRQANRHVPILWKNYEKAAIHAVQNPTEKVTVGKCVFSIKDKFLWVRLPSGRSLAYREPEITKKATNFGEQPCLEFLGVGLDKRSLRKERTWGGTLTENIVQAVARDIMKEAELRLERAKYPVLFSVHDEIICERKAGEGSVDEFTKIMIARPDWADEKLPLEAKGWQGPRYRK